MAQGVGEGSEQGAAELVDTPSPWAVRRVASPLAPPGGMRDEALVPVGFLAGRL